MTDCELVPVLLLRQQAVVRLVGVRDERLRADFDLSVIAPLVVNKVVGGTAARGLDARELTVFSIGIFDRRAARSDRFHAVSVAVIGVARGLVVCILDACERSLVGIVIIGRRIPICGCGCGEVVAVARVGRPLLNVLCVAGLLHLCTCEVAAAVVGEAVLHARGLGGGAEHAVLICVGVGELIRLVVRRGELRHVAGVIVVITLVAACVVLGAYEVAVIVVGVARAALIDVHLDAVKVCTVGVLVIAAAQVHIVYRLTARVFYAHSAGGVLPACGVKKEQIGICLSAPGDN